ncbi:hypothetical protein KI387_005575, partial [Taxus chinensis]
MGTQNVGITYGSSITSQTVGVQFSTIVETQGNTSSSLFIDIGGGSRGLGGLISNGSGGSGGGGDTR